MFVVGDLVWAKMKGFPPWPGRVVIPIKSMKRPAVKKVMHPIYFFGSENYAWIEDNNVLNFHEHKKTLSKQSKTTAFLDAVKAIEKYIEENPDSKKKAPTETPDEEEKPKTDEKENTPKASTKKIPKTPVSAKKTPKTPKDNKTPTNKRTLESSEKKSSSPKKKKVKGVKQEKESLTNHISTPRKSGAVEALLSRPSTVSKPIV